MESSRQENQLTPATVAVSAGEESPSPAGEQRGDASGGEEMTEAEQIAACWEEARIQGGIT